MLSFGDSRACEMVEGVTETPAESLVRWRIDGRREERGAGEEREEERQRGSRAGGFPTDSTLLDSVDRPAGNGGRGTAGERRERYQRGTAGEFQPREE